MQFRAGKNNKLKNGRSLRPVAEGDPAFRAFPGQKTGLKIKEI